ncbi:hypothetical protein [Pseudoruegeria sp. SHC-113]|uniref:hypothetical protein n=1 Tax=Pseudoruegeria sp. SHC-113 TaxID=2855439 RepID=UPI0021BAF4C6|nr:hypothetical protein [Pseudoruegeria sp. SHC-113]MCT8161284.1 hypothetical protein [Pseudoruegeria sp. SHC-113]
MTEEKKKNAINPKLVRTFAKAMWSADVAEQKFENAEARQAAFKATAKDYGKKARVIIRQLQKAGAEISIKESEAA